MSDELEVGVCATRLDLAMRSKLECLFKSAMRSKSHKNMIDFVKKFAVTSIGVDLV